MSLGNRHSKEEEEEEEEEPGESYGRYYSPLSHSGTISHLLDGGHLQAT